LPALRYLGVQARSAGLDHVGDEFALVDAVLNLAGQPVLLVSDSPFQCQPVLGGLGLKLL
jgi:hypothetical protein